MPDILLIGAGAYMCGKNRVDTGTILPTVIQAQRDGLVGHIHLVSNSPESARLAIQKTKEIESRLSFSSDISFYPLEGGSGPNYYQLLAKKIEGKQKLAIISTPDHTHFEMTKFLLNQNFHCLVVKPLVSSLDQVLPLAELAEQKKLINRVEFHKRWDQSNQLLHRALLNKEIGDLLYINVEYSQNIHVPSFEFSKWVTKTNVLQYLGIHYFDLIAHYTGARPLEARARGHYGILKEMGIDAYDLVTASIIWQTDEGSEFTVNISTNWIESKQSPYPSLQIIKAVGTKGRIDCDQANRGVALTTQDKFNYINPYFCQWLIDQKGEWSIQGYGPQSIRSFLVDVHNYQTLSDEEFANIQSGMPTFRSSYIPQLVLEMCQQSLQNNGKIIFAGDIR